MEIGVFTFADVSPDPGGVDAAQRLPELVEEIELANITAPTSLLRHLPSCWPLPPVGRHASGSPAR